MKRKIIQIPVKYTKRVGTSSVTGNKWVAFRLGLRMILLILDYRLRSWLSPARFAPRPLPTVDLVTEASEEEEKER
jgi:hypothetical protein